ncbi:lyase family protein [Nocardioides zeae]|uniref:3-carboxy-cis,cis-muconate cycloisomerase n=1 Tax=Nocardioides zeae TaxID=1457234 RepID=A0AAJ1X389_9ACTN|nr:lyase family protein [Nocardioides zeae]MDQ1105414.1 3-carboxy-cis,cis-muconate cycloisomerase [Nocardioides zeae]
MPDLLWPGDERAGDLLDDTRLLGSMVRIEQAWLDGLVAAGVAPAAAKADLPAVDAADAAGLALGAEGGGNPVVGLVRLLRERLRAAGAADAATWLHRGLTSQDVVDTALVLALVDALDRVDAALGRAADALADLAREHATTVMVGRTLTQHAVPTTFGLKAAGWLRGILGAADEVRRARALLPVQAGGAAGTLSALGELVSLAAAGSAGAAADPLAITDALADALGLARSVPWHSDRTPITRAGDALGTATQACGRIAADVLTLTRPEIAELGEPADEGRGGSSTMPQKQNPVLSVLVRRAAITTPGLVATLHAAAALADDERPTGSWHAEWATLRDLGRRSVVAVDQTAELVAGLRVHADAMAEQAAHAAATGGLLAERDAVRAVAGAAATEDLDPSTYLGVADEIVRRVVERADRLRDETRRHP